jgi:hypothetical protein
MSELNSTTHTWKQGPCVRRLPAYNNVSVDQVVAYAVRDDGKLCQESEMLDVWDNEQDLPQVEEIKKRLLSRLEQHLQLEDG